MLKVISFLLLLVGTAAQAQNAAPYAHHEVNDLLYITSGKVEVDSLQRLNLVLPKMEEKAPLLVWIGGGAWSYVNRNMEMDLARKVASEGIAVACVGHRLSAAIWHDSTQTEGAVHPQHADDIAQAMHWLLANADEYGYDRRKVFVGGFSSGAHLATILAGDSSLLQAVGLHPDTLKGVIAAGGAYDIIEYYERFRDGTRPHLAEQHVQSVFGYTVEQMRQASPTTFASAMSTPMLIMSDYNTYHYAETFETALLEADFLDYLMVHVHRLTHGDLWRDCSYEEHSIYRDLMVSFILNEA